MANDRDHDDSPHDADVDAELQRRVDERWEAFLEARRSLAEVMSDEELYEFGFNLEELDRKP